MLRRALAVCSALPIFALGRLGSASIAEPERALSAVAETRAAPMPGSQRRAGRHLARKYCWCIEAGRLRVTPPARSDGCYAWRRAARPGRLVRDAVTGDRARARRFFCDLSKPRPPSRPTSGPTSERAAPETTRQHEGARAPRLDRRSRGFAAPRPRRGVAPSPVNRALSLERRAVGDKHWMAPSLGLARELTALPAAQRRLSTSRA